MLNQEGCNVRADGKHAAGDAAQFVPFAALRGLEELFEQKVDESCREERHELTEEECLQMSAVLSELRKGDAVAVELYYQGHYVSLSGSVVYLDVVGRVLKLDTARIHLDDMRSLKRVE